MHNFISFRDHDAKVVQHEGIFYRLIYHHYATEYEHFMQSGLYQELRLHNLIIPHDEIPHIWNDQALFKTLRPKQIKFISYPFEWTANQWNKTVECFLKINLIALQYGMILKDATPYNFYFEGNTAVLFDTSSFIFYKDKQPWIAYKQFCEECFGPLALIHYKGKDWIKLHLQKTGMSLPFISKQLPARSKLNFSTLIHIHLHAQFYMSNATTTRKSNGLTKEKLILLHKSLLSTVEKWQQKKQASSKWSKYYESDLESETYLQAKETIIRSWIEQTKPSTVLDLGANTGHFSRLAAQFADEVCALESDHEAVERLVDIDLPHLKTIYADITEPSPGLGFMNKEIMSLLERCRADLTMGLALVHHLCITKRISFEHIAHLFATVTTTFCIVEFVPEDDQKVVLLKASSPKNYHHYSEESFTNAFKNNFTLLETTQIKGSNRKLFLFEKK